MEFKKINPTDISDNVFKMLNQDWTLITAGDEEKSNAMTASWGGLGILWNHPVATIYVRPQRYTYKFIEEQDTFSLSFFHGEKRSELSYMGSHSGKNADKYAESGLHPIMLDNTPCIEEASLVLICKKLYHHDIDPSLFEDDKECKQNYPGNDYHRMYIGEIISVYQK